MLVTPQTWLKGPVQWISGRKQTAGGLAGNAVFPVCVYTGLRHVDTGLHGVNLIFRASNICYYFFFLPCWILTASWFWLFCEKFNFSVQLNIRFMVFQQVVVHGTQTFLVPIWLGFQVIWGDPKLWHQQTALASQLHHSMSHECLLHKNLNRHFF